ncbi:MAG: AhpC/TSA family protein [Prevotella sp.]|nr:AhpC/TSA family protein [Prevotella sp.]
MKRLLYIVSLTLALVSCGSRNGHFKLKGRLLNLNQGEFFIYSTDGVFDGIDTIKVMGGRFSYETTCRENGTLVIVFPNFSEQPVFAQPGKSVTIKGDASHLKELDVNGTKENELMNGFRKQMAKASPPEETDIAGKFITDNPKSLASVYVLTKILTKNVKIGIDKLQNLAETVQKAQPNNSNVSQLVHYLKLKKNSEYGICIPSFTTVDINGKTVTSAAMKGKVCVVYTWATWNSESRSMRDRLNRLKNDYGNRLALIAICLDPSKLTCRQSTKKDSTSTAIICDQLMFNSPLLDKFGLGYVPDNVIFNAQGHVIERSLEVKDLETKLKNILN